MTSEALARLREGMTRPFQARIAQYLQGRFGISPHAPQEAFTRIAENFKSRGEQRFGAAFVYASDVQDASRSFTNIRRCFFTISFDPTERRRSRRCFANSTTSGRTNCINRDTTSGSIVRPRWRMATMRVDSSSGVADCRRLDRTHGGLTPPRSGCAGARVVWESAYRGGRIDSSGRIGCSGTIGVVRRSDRRQFGCSVDVARLCAGRACHGVHAGHAGRASRHRRPLIRSRRIDHVARCSIRRSRGLRAVGPAPPAVHSGPLSALEPLSGLLPRSIPGVPDRRSHRCGGRDPPFAAVDSWAFDRAG